MNLIVVGSTNTDLIISLPRIPKPGETILGGKSDVVFGGKGANQAIAAKRFGGSVGFITKLGADHFGESIVNHFQKEGLSSDLILTDSKESTGIAQIFVTDKGENCIGVAPGANMKLLPNDLANFSYLIMRSKVLLVQLEIPLESVEYLIDLAFENEVKLILNPAPACKLSDELLSKIWLITPNETEAEFLTGIAVYDNLTAQAAAENLLNRGVQFVIITLGSKGCLYAEKGKSTYFPSFEVIAIDSTAAGDVFNGTLAMAVANGKNIEETIKFASASAALSVTKKGAQTSIPTFEETTAFLEQFKSNVS